MSYSERSSSRATIAIDGAGFGGVVAAMAGRALALGLALALAACAAPAARTPESVVKAGAFVKAAVGDTEKVVRRAHAYHRAKNRSNKRNFLPRRRNEPKRRKPNARSNPGMFPTTHQTGPVRGAGAEPLRRRGAHPRRGVRTPRSPDGTCRLGRRRLETRPRRLPASLPAISATGGTGGKMWRCRT